MPRSPIRPPISSLAFLFSAAIAVPLSGCMMLEHALSPKIPVSPNLVLDDDTTWASAVPFNISGEWVDNLGGRVRIDESQGYGTAQVLTEESKFFWTNGTVSQINSAVTVERELSGEAVDRLHGRLGCTAAGDKVTLTIDFGDAGIWRREVDWKLAGQWHRDGVSIVLESDGYSVFNVKADPKLGWTGGKVTVSGKEARIELELRGGQKRTHTAELKVGPAFTMAMIEAANRQQAAAKR